MPAGTPSGLHAAVRPPRGHPHSRRLAVAAALAGSAVVAAAAAAPASSGGFCALRGGAVTAAGLAQLTERSALGRCRGLSASRAARLHAAASKQEAGKSGSDDQLGPGDAQFDAILNELEAAADEKQGALPPGEEAEEDPWAGPKEALGWVLVGDVFIVVFLALWFVLGVVLKYLIGVDGLLDVFLLYWDPYFQSLLGILFGARLCGILLQTALAQVRKSDDDDDYDNTYLPS
eukprot:CAMPEP_0170578824 /NCGR_PEP_ID=MMETSP0224-20130122/5661_1 /TAXON_ID=285029 /ORGANISM="Togula jolla, Strain CCCM 725" /LENGTH=232 /DNA_ID=CAMNT_0010901817 /DNA_START=78 /DNA_END=776 /DNA_ORIENTATION=+